VDKFGLQAYTSGYVDLTKPTRLKVERYKGDVYYYVNDKLVFHEPFQHFSNQNVGYYVENKTAIGVDWLRVYD
jgi:hypothetical protein